MRNVLIAGECYNQFGGCRRGWFVDVVVGIECLKGLNW